MTLDEKLAAAQSTEEMQEIYHQHLAATGAVELERGSNAVRVLSEPRIVERTVSTPSDAPAKCFRVIYPAGNARLEIAAASEEELNRIESAVRASYGR